MTTTTAPAPASARAHFLIRPALGTVGCYGRGHRGVCRRMPMGQCSGCGTQVAWHGDKGIMIPVGQRDGRVSIACWRAEHDCSQAIESQRDMAVTIWREVNPDLDMRNTLRVQIIALTDARPDVVARGGNVDGLDAAIASLRAQLDA